MSTKAIAALMAAVRVERQAEKKEARANRERALGAKQAALPDKKYGVIVADPEWRFEPWSRETGMDRAADNHYPTSGIEAIAERDVPSIAAADCVLFLWATAPMLPQGLRIMDVWGFEYRTHVVWAKDRIGTGYWFRNKHEILLVGVRGVVPAPAMGTQFASVIDAPIGKHSAKPDRFLEMVEIYFPTLPKIELNRRGPARAGWDAWGNEAQNG
jgi:N6-adenosine-specific RNA methylase IME4